jgi:hypothetical protein
VLKRPRKTYLAPGGRVLGSVADLTRQQTLDDSDVPSGPPNTAYCDVNDPEEICPS